MKNKNKYAKIQFGVCVWCHVCTWIGWYYLYAERETESGGRVRESEEIRKIEWKHVFEGHAKQKNEMKSKKERKKYYKQIHNITYTPNCLEHSYARSRKIHSHSWHHESNHRWSKKKREMTGKIIALKHSIYCKMCDMYKIMYIFRLLLIFFVCSHIARSTYCAICVRSHLKADTFSILIRMLLLSVSLFFIELSA